MTVPIMAVGPKNSAEMNPNVEVVHPIPRLLLKKETDIPSLYNEWEEQEVNVPGFEESCIFMHQIYHTILVEADRVFIKSSYSYHQQLYDENDGSYIGSMQMEINYIGTMKWNKNTLQ